MGLRARTGATTEDAAVKSIRHPFDRLVVVSGTVGAAAIWEKVWHVIGVSYAKLYCGRSYLVRL